MNSPYTGQYMTEDEIVVSYKQSKDKSKQVSILAELNLCSKDAIIDVLIKNGISGRSLPRKKSSDSVRTTSANKVQKSRASTNKTTSMLSAESVKAYITQLKQTRQDLLDQVNMIDDELKDIATSCG